MNLKQAAQAVGRSESTVSGWIRAGKLRASMVGRERSIDADELARLSREHGLAAPEGRLERLAERVTGRLEVQRTQTASVLDGLQELQRQQVAFTDYVARMVATLHEPPPSAWQDKQDQIEAVLRALARSLAAVDLRVESLDAHLNRIEQRVQYLAHLAAPGVKVMTTGEWAYFHDLEEAQLVQVLDAAGIGTSHIRGRAPDYVAPELHPEVAAALRAHGVAFTACEQCAQPTEEPPPTVGHSRPH
jgi:excisionase family DNA binding protein